MNIIIPMTGIGNRFVNAGYKTLKPLIKVHGKTMIEWVIDLFPGETNVTFICRHDHLQDTNLQSILTSAIPTSSIMPVDGHKEPVYAVSKIGPYR